MRLCQSLVAHPQVNLALSSTSPTRESVLAILLAITRASPAACVRSGMPELVLGIYDASLAPADGTIKRILRYAETAGSVAIAQLFKGWKSVAAGANSTTGFQRLATLDADFVYCACLHLLGNGFHDGDQSLTADPDVLLSLLTTYLAETDIDVKDFCNIVRANVLAVAICGLASHRKPFRIAADRVLARLRNRLQVCFTFSPLLLLKLRTGRRVS